MRGGRVVRGGRVGRGERAWGRGRGGLTRRAGAAGAERRGACEGSLARRPPHSLPGLHARPPPADERTYCINKYLLD